MTLPFKIGQLVVMVKKPSEIWLGGFDDTDHLLGKKVKITSGPYLMKTDLETPQNTYGLSETYYVVPESALRLEYDLTF